MTWLRLTLRSWSGRVGLALVAAPRRHGHRLATSGSPTTRCASSRRTRGSGSPATTGSAPTRAGKDLFSQVLVGARVSLFVALASALIAGVVGIMLGVAQRGHAARSLGESVAYLIDVLIALPTLVLALVLVGLFQGSLLTVSLAIGVGSGVVLARILRAEVARVLTQDYILAAHASGTSTWRTVRRHVLPNIAPDRHRPAVAGRRPGDPRRGGARLPRPDVADPPVVGADRSASCRRTVTVHPGAVVFPGCSRARHARVQPPRRRPARRHRPATAIVPDTAVVSPLVAARRRRRRPQVRREPARGRRADRSLRRARRGRRRVVHHRAAASGWRSSASRARARR